VPPRWLPWAAVFATAWLALFPIASVDAYYHLATGRRILETRSIPTRGVGSASFGQAPWHDNEWGFQALAASIGRAERDPASGVLLLTPAGRAGLVLLRAAVLAATMASLLATMTRAGVGPGLAALGVWLAAFLTFGNLFWDIRPQILSFLFLAVLVDLLERFRRGSGPALYVALALLALWSNVHGAVVLGCLAIACEAAGAWLERDRRRAVTLSVAAAAAPIAACLNPLGWRQLAFALDYARHPEIVAGNNEWSRPDLLHLPLLVLTVLVLVVASVAGDRPRPGQIVRVVAFGALFLGAIRHLPLFAIVLVPVTMEALARVGRLVPRRLPAVLAVAAGIVALSGAKQIALVPSFAERPSRALPERHARFLASQRIPGAGFNAYRFGGFLMFRLYPEERVMMDGRNDLYRSFRTDVYQPILEGRPGWESLWDDVVRRYRIGWALLDARDPLATHLTQEAEWLPISDEMSGIVLFLPNTSSNRHAVERFAP